MQWIRDEYRLSTDIDEFDFDVVHRYLSEVAYWSPGIAREKVERAARHSLAFGLFLRDAQIGYARMITDTVLRLAGRGLLAAVPSGAYLWGTERLYAWADGRPVP